MTYPPLSEQQCGNCRYMTQIGRISRECHRHAPQPSCDKNVPAWWPGVNKEDWCGEWSPKE